MSIVCLNRRLINFGVGQFISAILTKKLKCLKSFALQESISRENPPLEPEEEEWENRSGHRLSWKRYHRYKGEVRTLLILTYFIFGNANLIK